MKREIEVTFEMTIDVGEDPTMRNTDIVESIANLVMGSTPIGTPGKDGGYFGVLLVTPVSVTTSIYDIDK